MVLIKKGHTANLSQSESKRLKMVERSRITFLTGAVVSIIMSSCAWPRSEHSSPYAYPSHYYDYWYFPDRHIYYHIYSGWYYYRDHGRWWRVRHLPPHISPDWSRRRRFNMRGSTPWQQHQEDRQKYRSAPKRRRLPDSERRPRQAPRRTSPSVYRDGNLERPERNMPFQKTPRSQQRHPASPMRSRRDLHSRDTPPLRIPSDRSLQPKRKRSADMHHDRGHNPRQVPAIQFRHGQRQNRSEREGNSRRRKEPKTPPVWRP